MLNASALLGQSAGALAVRNPWSGAARLTRGAIAHQSNFYKTFYRSSNRMEHYVPFKTYTFGTVQAENSTNGARRQTYRALTSDLTSSTVLSPTYTGINLTYSGYIVSTTELTVLKSAGADTALIQCFDYYNGTNFQAFGQYTLDGVSFSNMPYYTRRCHEANSRLFLFDSATNSATFTNVYTATTANFLATPSSTSPWVAATLPVGANWEKVIYGNSRWLIIAPRQMKICYSTDGVNWVEFTNASAFWNNTLASVGNMGMYDFRFDGSNFVLTAINGGRIQAFNSPTGEFWTPISEYMLDDHQMSEMSGNLLNGVYPRNNSQYSGGDMATPPAYYNGQWFFKVRAYVPMRTVAGSGTGGWETEFLLSTPDFLVWNKHPDHYVGQRPRDTTNPNSALGWASDRVNADSFQNYSNGGVYSLSSGAPFFNPGPGYGAYNLSSVLIADTTNAKEVYYAV